MSPPLIRPAIFHSILWFLLRLSACVNISTVWADGRNVGGKLWHLLDASCLRMNNFKCKYSISQHLFLHWHCVVMSRPLDLRLILLLLLYLVRAMTMAIAISAVTLINSFPFQFLAFYSFLWFFVRNNIISPSIRMREEKNMYKNLISLTGRRKRGRSKSAHPRKMHTSLTHRN